MQERNLLPTQVRPILSLTLRDFLQHVIDAELLEIRSKGLRLIAVVLVVGVKRTHDDIAHDGLPLGLCPSLSVGF